MQIYFHRHLFSHLSRVPILVEGTVHTCMYTHTNMDYTIMWIFLFAFTIVFFFYCSYHRSVIYFGSQPTDLQGSSDVKNHKRGNKTLTNISYKPEALLLNHLYALLLTQRQ